MRNTVWRFLQGDAIGAQLIALAREIALGGSVPPRITSAPCPGINYLANGETPAAAPQGLSSYLPGGFQLTGFTGLNFPLLRPLSDAKSVGILTCPVSPERECGFETGGLAGLSILFGGWSDFCLWCWAKHRPTSVVRPTLILASDNGPLAGATRLVTGGIDWGYHEASDVRRFWQFPTVPPSPDLSTGRLFREIAVKAYGSAQALDAEILSGPVFLDRFEEYVGSNRIFIYNVWPWFRTGSSASGADNVHGDFGKIPQLVEPVKRLIQVLDPENIITLGGWAVQSPINAPSCVTHPWLQSACGQARKVFHLYHPCSKEWQEHNLGRAGLSHRLP